MLRKVTAPMLPGMKAKGERIVCVTAYDYTSALMVEQCGIDVVLVGDSLGNMILGHSTTLPVTLGDMVHHTAAVRRGLQTPLLVADLPFGSYNISDGQAVESSIALMQVGAEAVKLEGDYPEAIRAIVRAGIPVMGHIGFTPQSVHSFGGFKVQGRGERGEKLKELAFRLQEAGCFALVLELIPAALAKEISSSLDIPTIGIGAGIDCDGEIQVFHDIMGLNQKVMKHTKVYAEAGEAMRKGMKQYVADVRGKLFPTGENSF
ncbi:MAG: 3-methyl-2-oxobutanoate hydroxymethyltransferase [Fimbriimonadaceae bacterium]|jgi:3-methyl-2-oxobutanoate hydroxymethyltransferase|nr:3-methyl-2-oxobutanoate hydroxymethyltransferase [Fimbriimonadaceae bacterium]